MFKFLLANLKGLPSYLVTIDLLLGQICKLTPLDNLYMFSGFIKFMSNEKNTVKVGEGEVKIYKSSEKKSERCSCKPPVRNRLCKEHGG